MNSASGPWLEQPCPVCAEPTLGHARRDIARALCRECLFDWNGAALWEDECCRATAARFAETIEEAQVILDAMRATAQHAADFDRTRINPGADPRMLWASTVDERESPTTPNPVYEVRPSFDTGALRALQGELEYLVDEWGFSRERLRFVPEDVRRWRNGVHRSELTRRARELAATTPNATVLHGTAMTLSDLALYGKDLSPEQRRTHHAQAAVLELRALALLGDAPPQTRAVIARSACWMLLDANDQCRAARLARWAIQAIESSDDIREELRSVLAAAEDALQSA